MIRYPPGRLLTLDRRISRCDNCGAWRFDHHCTTCDETENDK